MVIENVKISINVPDYLVFVSYVYQYTKTKAFSTSAYFRSYTNLYKYKVLFFRNETNTFPLSYFILGKI